VTRELERLAARGTTIWLRAPKGIVMDPHPDAIRFLTANALFEGVNAAALKTIASRRPSGEAPSMAA